MRTLFDELNEQPQALRSMLDFYREEPVLLDLPLGSAGGPLVLAGMGASYHAAWIGALHFNSLGIPAAAYEAVDLIHYMPGVLASAGCVLYISQSGESGEVAPLLDALGPGARLVAVTNNLQSTLAQRAGVALPMLGGEEAYIAGKTYLNPLAILWLKARRAAGRLDGRAWDALYAAADAVEKILRGADATAGRLMSAFDTDRPLLFAGHGPHAATARQAAMILGEWAKQPAHQFGIGAFRHGFIETVRPGDGALIFSAPGRTQASARALARELAEIGALPARVECGRLIFPGDQSSAEADVDEFLCPILDILPIQLYADALAAARGVQPGFRYISKVVRNL